MKHDLKEEALNAGDLHSDGSPFNQTYKVRNVTIQVIVVALIITAYAVFKIFA